MAPNEVEPGDRVRYMQPTRVPGGFVDCRTVLTVCAPAQAYWTALDGRRVLVPLLGEVDKVVE
jgi:hypothetical protein